MQRPPPQQPSYIYISPFDTPTHITPSLRRPYPPHTSSVATLRGSPLRCYYFYCYAASSLFTIAGCFHPISSSRRKRPIPPSSSWCAHLIKCIITYRRYTTTTTTTVSTLNENVAIVVALIRNSFLKPIQLFECLHRTFVESRLVSRYTSKYL